MLTRALLQRQYKEVCTGENILENIFLPNFITFSEPKKTLFRNFAARILPFFFT
jgi:hypothetical protein